MTDFDIKDLNQELDDLELVLQAKQRYSESEPYYARLFTDYRVWHHWYAPRDADQWPEDIGERPGMIHITHNIIRPFVDTEARVESKLPRISLAPNSEDEDEAARAEKSEKLILRFLGMSGWEVWLNTLNKCRGIYGKGVLKILWDESESGAPPRPDVNVVENPANLRIGWGTSDFSKKDWVIYEYRISPYEFMESYPGFEAVPPVKRDGEINVIRAAGDHSDPLEQKATTRYQRYQPSEYENKHINIWDYWFKRSGKVINAVIANGALVRQKDYPDFPDIPYIVVELDHEPGSPEGLPVVRDLMDVQLELNRALSHFAQLVNDEIDPAWQSQVDSIPPGMVPKGGDILATGDASSGGSTKIEPIAKPVNQFPIQQLVQELYKAAHFGTGLPDIMFSLPPGAQTAGRALQIQIEASANRIEPRRNLLYNGLKQLLIFWTIMLERRNPKIKLPTGEFGVGDLVKGFRDWKMVAPEITPRDVIENTTNVINKVQAKVISLAAGMDELGVDSPIEMLKAIERERTNPKLFPGDTQAFAAVIQLLIQLVPMFQQMGLSPDILGVAGAGQAAQGQRQLEAQNAQPTLDQVANQSGPPMPMSQAGSPPPAGGPAPIANQSLIRNLPTGGATALQQIALRPGGGA